MTNKYTMVDVWYCAKCHIEWKVPAVPHRPECPRCGVGGWWKRFASALELKRASEEFERGANVIVSQPR